MPEPLTLFLSVIFGAIGVGFLIYGKKQAKPVPLIVGLTLIIFPYFVSNHLVLIAVGVLLTTLPALIKL